MSDTPQTPRKLPRIPGTPNDIVIFVSKHWTVISVFTIGFLLGAWLL